MRRTIRTIACLSLLGGVLFPSVGQSTLPVPLKQSEQERITVVGKVKPAVVSVFGMEGWGGGSGVIIDPEGYALTNAHVVMGGGGVSNFMRCGLSNGVLYDTVLVGLDRVGDVALIKLIPKKPGDKFPFAPMGDSDKVQPGDWSLAMGNPFVLATDFDPTVTYGLISGTHRYQHPSGGFLEYTDCIQTDTSINPGNSGGPLFNMKGEIIGINGRIMFAMEKRVRINSGHGYAISINQIKNFLGHFYAGIDTDHATLGATFKKTDDNAELMEMLVDEVLEESDAKRRGITEGDSLVSFAGRPIGSLNEYKNILGIFPNDWRLPMVTRRGNERRESLVRLMPYQPAKDPNQVEEKKAPKMPIPQLKKEGGAKTPADVQKMFKARAGYANYYFNEKMRDALLTRSPLMNDFNAKVGNWSLSGTGEREGRANPFTISVGDTKADKDSPPVTKSRFSFLTDYSFEPLKLGQSDLDRSEPPGSGGLLMAVYQLRRFLTLNTKGFEGNNFTHGGWEPIYTTTKEKPNRETRLLTEVIRTEHADVKGKWYFTNSQLGKHPDSSLPDGVLAACEIFVASQQDPCEIYFSDYKKVDGQWFPHRWDVWFGDKRFTTLQIQQAAFTGGEGK